MPVSLSSQLGSKEQADTRVHINQEEARIFFGVSVFRECFGYIY